MSASRRARRVVALLGALLGTVLVSCGGGASAGSQNSQNSLHLVNPGYLTVATHASLAPEIVVGPGQHIGGMDGVLFNAFVKEHHLKIKLYQTTFPSMILAVRQGKADIGEGVFYTADRAKQVRYTYPFWLGRAAVITLKSTPYKNAASFQDKTIGTVIGYVWAPYLQKVFGARAKLYQDEATVGQALLNGQIDGYVNGASTVDAPPLTAKKVAAHLLKPGDWGMPDSALTTIAHNIVKCDNTGLESAMNKTLSEQYKSGAWLKALKSYHLDKNSQAQLKTVKQLCT
jgi:polar amino acid transport system substrate-binding protein